jgi:Flp pilus assembly protein TadG
MLKKFAKNEEGSTIIEFAIISPVLFLIMLAIVEFSMVMYSTTVLDQALISASRAGKTGYVNATANGQCPSPVVNGTVVPQTQAQYINCIVGVHVSGLLNPNLLQISYRDTGSTVFNTSTDTPTYTSNCTNTPSQASNTLPLCAEGAQGAGDIVVYTVTYPWPIITPMIQHFLGTNGIYTLTASAVVKNEPY